VKLGEALRSVTTEATPKEQFSDLIGMWHLEVGCQATASFDQQTLKLPGLIAA
jgi:hypothetical protein